MLIPILQSLREVKGVQGAMIVDDSAAVIAYDAHAIYDLPVLQQVARAIASTVDSVQLVQDDWDTLSAQYGDGKLLLRNLRVTGGKPRSYVLVVIADQTLNAAFLGVALRVAANKALAALEVSRDAVPAPSPPIASSTGSVVRPPASEPPRPALARSGVAWSGSSVNAPGSGSEVAGSQVSVADAESAALLSECTRALAAHIGPIAKRQVRTAVRSICGDRPFTRADGRALIARLSAGIEDDDDRATFLRVANAL